MSALEPSPRVAVGHMPQLDGLRAIAVGAVVLYHFGLNPTGGNWGYGAAAGVHLFFVLSGFLITGILLKARADIAAARHTRAGVLGRFYARRCLRIFPLYYFVIACALVLNVEPVREIIGWLLSYTLNIKMAQQGWYEAGFAHFWTLAVEEQFYVFWPWLIILLPSRWLKPVIILAVLVAPAYRLSYVVSGYSNMSPLAVYISTLTCLDSLGIGSFLALTAAERRDGRVVSRRTLAAVLVICASVLLLNFWYHPLSIVLNDTAQAGLFACLIASAAPGFPGWLGRLLESQPLCYLGRISYGIYVYHPFMPALVSKSCQALGVNPPENKLIHGTVLVATSLALASLSWFLLEKPILRLKRYF